MSSNSGVAMNAITMSVRRMAVVGAAAVIGSLLAFTTVGRAASPNICNTSSIGNTNASCVDQTVAPHVLTANEDAVSITLRLSAAHPLRPR